MDLAHEVVEVVLGRARLWMEFRIGRYFDVEMIAVLGADELHQLVGVTKLAGRHHAGRDVATQGDDMSDAVVAVFVEDGPDILAGGTDAGQVRRGGVAFTADFQHCRQRPVAGGAAGAKGDGEKLRLELSQLLARGAQLGNPFRGLGRKEFETEGSALCCHDLSVSPNGRLLCFYIG